MQEVIKNVKDFKIIPNNFKSSATFNLLDVNEKSFCAELNLIDEKEISDYSIGSVVEIFGVNNIGLVYFETRILDKENNKLTLEMTQDYSVIQRREYSRVELNQGNIIFKDKADNFVLNVCDISAGGIKLITKEPLEIDKHYEILISLSNNMKIECALAPIRISEEDGKFVISGKFVDLDNSDRIVLVQYAFKVKIEEQNKEND